MSKEYRFNKSFVLGGLYMLTDTPLAFFDNALTDLVSSLITIAFFYYVIRNLLGEKVDWLEKFISRFPIFSYYLASVGWFAYAAMILAFVVIILFQYFPQWNDTTAIVLVYGGFWAFPLFCRFACWLLFGGVRTIYNSLQSLPI